MSENVPQRPFAALNLRRNPFGQVPLDDRPQLAVVDVDEWVQQVHSGTVVEFVGAAGRGKSTHLRVMAAQMDAAAYVHVREDRPPPAMPDRPVLCVDEAQFLPPWTRRALYRSDAALALGTHTSLAKEIEAAGRTVETVSLGGRTIDAAFLRQIVANRLEWARRDNGPVPRLSDAAIEWLLKRYEDNIRAMEHHLYAVFQNLETVRRVVPDDLEAAEAPPDRIVERADPPVRTSSAALLRRLRGFGTTLWETLRRHI